MDPVICCLLGICCPPFSEEQRVKLAGMLEARYHVAESYLMAGQMIEGMRPVIVALQPLIAEARKHA